MKSKYILGANKYTTSTGVIVAATQWNGFNTEEVKSFIPWKIRIKKHETFFLNGELVNIGDYIIDNLTGQLYLCKKDIFLEGYNKIKNNVRI